MALSRFFMYTLSIHHCFSICLTCTESWGLAYCIIVLHGLDVLVHDFEHVLYKNTALYSKTIFVAPLGIKRSDTSHCFVFVSWCQCLWFWVVHWLLELVFILLCCQFTIFIVLHTMGSQQWEYVGYASHQVCILITGLLASLFTIQLAIIWFL